MKKTHAQFLSRAVNVAVTHQREEGIVATLEAIRRSKSPVLSLIRDIAADSRFYKVMEDTFLWKRFAVASVERFIDDIDPPSWKDSGRIERLRNEFLAGWLARNMFPLTTLELKRELAKISSLSAEEIDRLAEADYSGKIELELQQPEEEDFGEGVFDCTSGKGPDDMALERLPLMFTDEESASSDDEGDEGDGAVGPGEGDRHYEKPVALNSYDRELQRLAMMIGRNGGESFVFRPGKFLRAGKSDIEGITVGNDLSAVLPAELALLASPATENLFYDRYSKSRLQVFASASEVKSKEAKRKMGPVIISVDTSGSMAGEPERMAKSLSLAICEIAQRRQRPVCLINYSDDVSVFILTDIKSQRRQLMNFLSLSYGGGNYEERMFRFIFETLPESKKYPVFKESFDNADLLVVSDFLWAPLSPGCVELLEKVHEYGMRFYALGIGYGDAFRIGDDENFTGGNPFSCPWDTEAERLDGYGFFGKCDYRFSYDLNNGKCSEITESRKKSKTNGSRKRCDERRIGRPRMDRKRKR